MVWPSFIGIERYVTNAREGDMKLHEMVEFTPVIQHGD